MVMALFKAEATGCGYHPASLTRPCWDPARPDRSRKTRPALPLPGCTPRARCCSFPRLSSAAPPLRCGSLWGLPPPLSGGPSWSDSSPSPKRSLGDRDRGKLAYTVRGHHVFEYASLRQWGNWWRDDVRFTQVAVGRSRDQVWVLFDLISRLKRTVVIDAHFQEGVVLLFQAYHTWRGGEGRGGDKGG